MFRKLTVKENILAVLEALDVPAKKRNRAMEKLLGEFKISHIAQTKGAGIDPIAVLDIQNIIGELKEKGIGVLISDHNVRETLRVCDKAYILNQGKVLEYGEPMHIAESRKAREIYLGERFSL
ncbi:MAG: sugar transporter ATP-binding protein [Geobacteraceae bacterium]|nr:sugar transporter ATP-binding protein [Geobacteraceae bacterium]